jgi:hypothetical protein
MTEWWRYLKGRPFYWVLDGSDPAAAYYMLRYVVERPDSARAVQAARLALQESPAVAHLKARLIPEGIPEWNADYSGPLWALRLLAEWGHPGDDEAIATCLDWALDHDTPTHPHAALLLLHTALAFGFSEDDRVKSRLHHVLATLQEEDPSELSAVEVVLAAMALATLPVAEIPKQARTSLESRFAHLDPTALPAFAAYAYPTFGTPDGLTLAESALRLEFTGAWLERWVEQIVAAQDEGGLWRAARVYLPDASPNEPNRWLSAKALYVLRSYYGE